MTFASLMTQFGVVASMGAAGLIAGLSSLVWTRRVRALLVRETEGTRRDLETQLRECLLQLAAVSHQMEKIEDTAKPGYELPGDGRLGTATRSKAMRMLRTGVAAETAAAELGLPKAEIRLLGRINILLSPAIRVPVAPTSNRTTV